MTSVALSLLLLFGVVGLGHSGPAEAGDAAASVLMVDEALGSTSATATTPVPASSDAESSGILCAIGLFCGVIALLFLRRRLRQPQRALVTTRGHAQRVIPVSISRRVPTLSLTGLGISRT
ncbi:hypothetical protein LJR045_002077 [Microbacterium sp. LjRoot45]|uniref:hypothetical protein n=1 Tax=Microbacterium sp. LjRoot45 TaxID=3342329 RepID=UPI003ECFCE76